VLYDKISESAGASERDREKREEQEKIWEIKSIDDHYRMRVLEMHVSVATFPFKFISLLGRISIDLTIHSGNNQRGGEKLETSARGNANER
jgi:hypothetical protein